jgi:hypothetical protein
MMIMMMMRDDVDNGTTRGRGKRSTKKMTSLFWVCQHKTRTSDGRRRDDQPQPLANMCWWYISLIGGDDYVLKSFLLAALG